MSVTINLSMTGDFEKERNREIAIEISDAIQAVLDKQPDLSWKGTSSISETKTAYQIRSLDKTEFKPNGSSHQITFSSGFHCQ